MSALSDISKIEAATSSLVNGLTPRTFTQEDVKFLLRAFKVMREIAIKAAVGDRKRMDVENGRRVFIPYEHAMELAVDTELEEAMKRPMTCPTCQGSGIDPKIQKLY